MPLFGEPGERIAYRVYAGSGGPPLVLLHGFTASSASFSENVGPLGTWFTVVTVELLGHGDSESPADPAAYAARPAIDRILGLFDHLGFDRVLLCGHSLGGAVALRLALDAPERLAGLVVINSNSAAGTPAWREGARHGMAEMARRARAEGTAFLSSTRLYPAHSRRLPPRARDLLTRDFDRLTPEGFAGTAEALVIDVNSYERLPELAVPMLLVLGERDTDVMRNAPAFIERLPADLLEVVRLPEAGHAANLEQPDQFHAAMVDFAERIGHLESALAPEEHRPRLRGQLLTGAGVLMVVAGIALVAAAFLLDRGGGPSTQQAFVPIEASPTRTPMESVSGVRTQGAGPALGTPATPAATATSAPNTPTAAATATATPVRQQALAPTATPQPPTETPVPPTPTATSTPAGPYAAIAGPSTAKPGESVTFSSISAPGELRSQWTALGATKNTGAWISVTFPQAGCFPVTLTVFYPPPAGPKTATVTVAVGGAQCP